MKVQEGSGKQSAGINLSVLGLCTVAFLGFVLRTKMLFNIPFINYNYLTDAHGHFAFSGWVTLALAVLMVRYILPAEVQAKVVYKWLTGSIFTLSWLMLFSYSTSGNGHLSNIFLTLFIITGYIFAWVFIRDAILAKIDKTVLLLSIGALVSLSLSSVGAFALAYLFSIQSLNAVLYRDAMFTYLHFQYNGFFSLAVFALLFQYFIPMLNDRRKRVIRQFSSLLASSIIPSLFLSYLWHDPRPVFWAIAILGSALVFLTFIWFVISIGVMHKTYHNMAPVVKYMLSVSIIAFAIKTFLQMFLIFPAVGDQVFGNRPVIMAYLHLVFLGFVTHFVLGYYANSCIINTQKLFTRISLLFFSLAVIANEAVLAMQGLSFMFNLGYSFCMWLLWAIGIALFTSAMMIAASRIKVTSKGRVE